MKSYEKPKLIALSLAGNERLCGDCADAAATHLLYNDQSGIAHLLDRLIGNENGALERKELTNAFSDSEACVKSTGDFYCKFTGVTTVAWS